MFKPFDRGSLFVRATAISVLWGFAGFAAAKEPDARSVEEEGPAVTASQPLAKRPSKKVALRADRPGRKAMLLGTGFRANREAGEVVIQTSAEAELIARPITEKEATVFVLKHCRSLRRIDRLPLETQYFDSPVTRVSVAQRGDDLEIAISLRQAVAAVTRKEQGPAGSWFWVLAFPTPAEKPTTTASATP